METWILILSISPSPPGGVFPSGYRRSALSAWISPCLALSALISVQHRRRRRSEANSQNAMFTKFWARSTTFEAPPSMECKVCGTPDYYRIRVLWAVQHRLQSVGRPGAPNSRVLGAPEHSIRDCRRSGAHYTRFQALRSTECEVAGAQEQRVSAFRRSGT